MEKGEKVVVGCLFDPGKELRVSYYSQEVDGEELDGVVIEIHQLDNGVLIPKDYVFISLYDFHRIVEHVN